MVSLHAANNLLEGRFFCLLVISQENLYETKK